MLKDINKNSQLVNEIVKSINTLIVECQKQNIVWDSLKFYKVFNNQLNTIFLDLDKLIGKRINWYPYIIKNNVSSEFNVNDLDNMIKSVVFRDITFIFPLYGVQADKEIIFDEATKIIPIKNLSKLKNDLANNDTKKWKWFLAQDVNVLCITTKSDIESDGFAYNDCHKKAKEVIDLLNFCMKAEVSLTLTLTKFDFLPPFKENAIYVVFNDSPFVIEESSIRNNNLKWVPSVANKIPFDPLEFKFDEIVDIEKAKNFYTRLINTNNLKDKTILKVIGLVSDSIIEENEDSKFLKLISAYDALLERKSDKRGIKEQLAYNSCFILNFFEEEDINNLKHCINSGYKIRSKIVHEGETALGFQFETSKKVYIELLKYIRKMILNLLIVPKFSEITSMFNIYELLDQQCDFGKIMLSYYFLLILIDNVGDDHYIPVKKVKRKVNDAINHSDENNSFTNYAMFKYDQINIEANDESFASAFKYIKKKMIEKHICEVDENKRIKLVDKIDKKTFLSQSSIKKILK